MNPANSFFGDNYRLFTDKYNQQTIANTFETIVLHQNTWFHRVNEPEFEKMSMIYFKKIYNNKKLLAALANSSSWLSVSSAGLQVNLDLLETSVFNLLKRAPSLFLNWCIKDYYEKSGLLIEKIALWRKKRKLELSYFSRIRVENLTKLIFLRGLIRKSVGPYVFMKLGLYYCSNCHDVTYLYNKFKYLEEPRCKNQNFRKCKNWQLVLLEKESTFVNRHLILLQENCNTNQFKRAQIALIIDNLDSKHSLIPGETIVVGGIIEKEQKESSQGRQTPIFEIYLRVIFHTLEQKSIKKTLNSLDIEKLKKMKKNILKEGVKIVGDGIHGWQSIKIALVLQLVGGVRKKNLSTTVRGSLHSLLVGDPGLAKSQLLKNVIKISNGILVSATSSTSIGLTASVVKDQYSQGHWSIEAGAIVLADGRILAIDQADKFKGSEILNLHQAMQQQTVSIAKAGIVSTLNCQTSVIASANPKFGKFKKDQEYLKQITLPITVINRFDFIFIMADSFDAKKDQKLIEYIVNQNRKEKIKEQDLENFRNYIAYARTFEPLATTRAKKYIISYFVGLKSKNNDNNLIIGNRQLETIIRTSQSWARLNLRSRYTHLDVIKSIKLLNFTVLNNKNKKVDTNYFITGHPNIDKKNLKMIYNLLVHKKEVTKNKIIEIFKNTFTKEQILDYIYMLKKDGLIYQPDPGLYRVIV